MDANAAEMVRLIHAGQITAANRMARAILETSFKNGTVRAISMPAKQSTVGDALGRIMLRETGEAQACAHCGSIFTKLNSMKPHEVLIQIEDIADRINKRRKMLGNSELDRVKLKAWISEAANSQT